MANSRKRARRTYRVRLSPTAASEAANSESEAFEQHATGSLPKDQSRFAAVLNAPGGTLLVLRAFLGVTFVFAGLQKLANADFFSATAPGSFQQQLRGSIITSPLHHLLAPVLHVAPLVAVLISLGEVAVGLGTFLGLFGRLAAVGGALLSLSFFLTVSFNDNPYFYGADIVFLFAWTPLVLGGSGIWSLDAIYATRAARARASLHFAAARGGAATRRRSEELERRVFLQRMSAAGLVALSGVAVGGLIAALGRLFHTPLQSPGSGSIGGGTSPNPNASATSSPTAQSTTPPSAPTSAPGNGSIPKGTRIGPASDVPVGGAASFTDPAQGIPALVVQVNKGTFRAFSAVCPHAGCQVQFDQQNDVFACPCHGSIFNARTGAVEQGPAASGLPTIAVALGSNGQLYVDG